MYALLALAWEEILCHENWVVKIVVWSLLRFSFAPFFRLGWTGVLVLHIQHLFLWDQILSDLWQEEWMIFENPFMCTRANRVHLSLYLCTSMLRQIIFLFRSVAEGENKFRGRTVVPFTFLALRSLFLNFHKDVQAIKTYQSLRWDLIQLPKNCESSCVISSSQIPHVPTVQPGNGNIFKLAVRPHPACCRS